MGETMGETVGSGEITSKNKTTKVINTYEITLFNKPGVPAATLAQVEQVLLDLQVSADAHNLTVEIVKNSPGTIL